MENITREELIRMMEIVNAWKAEAENANIRLNAEGKFYLADDAWRAVDTMIWMKYYIQIAAQDKMN